VRDDDTPSDATRRKSAEQALRSARDLLRHALLAIERGELEIGEFARATAPQLQQPLAVVREFARTLRLDAGSAPAETLAFADRIDAEAAYAQAQIAELLAKVGR